MLRAIVSAALVVFLVSIGAGGFGSLVGIGGGLIIVPVLSTLLGYDIKVAIAASLIGVIATSVGATGHYLATGIADRRLGVTLLVATALGGLTGGLVSRYLDARMLALLFGILLLFVAIQMTRQLRGSAAVDRRLGRRPRRRASTPATSSRRRARRWATGRAGCRSRAPSATSPATSPACWAWAAASSTCPR